MEKSKNLVLTPGVVLGLARAREWPESQGAGWGLAGGWEHIEKRSKNAKYNAKNAKYNAQSH